MVYIGQYGDTLMINFNSSDRQVSKKDRAKIVQMLSTPSVTALDIIGNKRLSDDEVTKLLSCVKGPRLTVLHLSHNEIKCGGIGALVEILKDSSLIELNLDNTNIGYEGICALLAASKNSSLTELYLVRNNIGCAEANAIAARLHDCDCNLRVLDLSDNNIRYEGIKEIAAALPDSSLVALDLSFNHVGNEGAKEIAAALISSSLLELNVSYSHVGRDGVNEFIKVLPTLSLTSLYMRNKDKMTDADCENLIESIKDTTMTDLDINVSKQIKETIEDITKTNKANLKMRRFKRTKAASKSNASDAI